jgi:hypothetical protein
VDSSTRTLGFLSFTSATDMTPSSCQASCASAGYLFAGIEYSQEVRKSDQAAVLVVDFLLSATVEATLVPLKQLQIPTVIWRAVAIRV